MLSSPVRYIAILKAMLMYLFFSKELTKEVSWSNPIKNETVTSENLIIFLKLLLISLRNYSPSIKGLESCTK